MALLRLCENYSESRPILDPLANQLSSGSGDRGRGQAWVRSEDQEIRRAEGDLDQKFSGRAEERVNWKKAKAICLGKKCFQSEEGR